MRISGMLAAMILLAGCDAPEPADRGVTNVVAPASPDIAPPAPPAAPPPAAPAEASAGTGIPERFLGVYDGSAKACARPSDERLTVAAGELRFHESIGSVRGVAAAGPDAVRVEADFQGEGETWRSSRELRLSEGGETLTISGDGTRLVRVRCPAGAR